MLIYHVDDTVEGNDNERHPLVKLMEADNLGHLHNGSNRGDEGDPYPGRSANRTFDGASSPGSQSYAGIDTCVVRHEHHVDRIDRHGRRHRQLRAFTENTENAEDADGPEGRERREKGRKPQERKKTAPPDALRRRLERPGLQTGRMCDVQIVYKLGSHRRPRRGLAAAGRSRRAGRADGAGSSAPIRWRRRIANPLPNLLRGHEGQSIQVQVPAAAAAAFAPGVGARVALDVRRGRKPRVFFARPEGITTESGS